ncbi:hypothetical protein [Aquisalimonas asiatica]|uniref:Uncharacterized protein n=1 Tax=Aquisalimonas asiatica TaxID=406100 RepID=A0A1H8TN41_9GAMM|nr:hypothetical protein [Aquisalimonas asiatica]SEO92459.1 hypothetical protein SAMN04488052_104340 [Aquisalimonas asiatica]
MTADRLQALERALASEQPLPADVRDWLREGVIRHLRGEPLERALEVHAPGNGADPAWRTIARRRRDAWLRLAAGEVDGSTKWARAVALESQVLRYLEATAKRWRDLDEPPGDAPAVKRYIHKAARTGEKLPESRWGLMRILQ